MGKVSITGQMEAVHIKVSLFMEKNKAKGNGLNTETTLHPTLTRVNIIRIRNMGKVPLNGSLETLTQGNLSTIYDQDMAR